MRRAVLLGVIATAAVLGAGVGVAQGFVPPRAPDPGVTGGGFTLVDPAGRNVESNRARFEFALRQSQATGLIRGKSLTMRATCSTAVAATDGSGFVGTRCVARSWTPTPYAGIPPYPGGGAVVRAHCGLDVSGNYGSFYGTAALLVVDGAGTEHRTAVQFDYFFELLRSARGDFVAVSADRALPLPLPGESDSTVVSGAAGTIEGVQAPSCV